MYLDEGLWMEILKSLPVDVLLRFRSLCKSWKSLISSPAFIRAHYLSSSSNSADQSKTFILFDTQVECSTCYAFYTPGQLISQSKTQRRFGFQTVPFDLAFSVISDVIRGVVCLSRSVYSYPADYPVFGYTILWNPTIRKSVKIPRRDSTLDVGFGFDGRKNDFKVVRSDQGCWEKPINYLEVYSYREGRSKTLDSDHIGPFNLVRRSSCFINGTIHWIIRRQNCSRLAILMFDCESEELKTMELPQRLNEPGLNVVIDRLFVHFGKVSVLEAMRTEGDEKGETAVWVMDEYGVATSWKKTAYHKDFAKITQDGIFKLQDGYNNAWTSTNKEGIKRSQPPMNGHVFEPNMLLMEGERVPTKRSLPEDLLILGMLSCHQNDKIFMG